MIERFSLYKMELWTCPFTSRSLLAEKAWSCVSGGFENDKIRQFQAPASKTLDRPSPDRNMVGFDRTPLQISLTAFLEWRLVLLIGMGVCSWLAKRLVRGSVRNPRRLLLPPGPKGLPLLGNVFQLSPRIWETYRDWSHTYGKLPTEESFS